MDWGEDMYLITHVGNDRISFVRTPNQASTQMSKLDRSFLGCHVADYQRLSHSVPHSKVTTNKSTLVSMSQGFPSLDLSSIVNLF